MLYANNYTVRQMAAHFHCSRRVVHHRLKSLGLSIENRFIALTQEEIEAAVADVQLVWRNCIGILAPCLRRPMKGSTIHQPFAT